MTTTYTRDEPLFATARQKGEAAATVCLANTRQEQHDWPERAYRMLTTYILIHKDKDAWTAEDATAFVLRQPGIEPPHDTRAFGSLFSRAARAGLIRRTGETYQREHGHGSPALKWRTA
jgi:hypothetical protein